MTLSSGWPIFGCQPSLSPWPHLGFIDRNHQTFSRCAAFPSSGLVEAWIPPPDVRVPLCPTLICPACLLQEEGPLPEPKSGLLSNTWEMNFSRRHMCWQSKRLYREGHLDGEQEGKGTQEDCSAMWLPVSVLWWWDSFPGCLWPVIPIQGPSWCFTHYSAKMDSSQQDSGRLAGHVDWSLLSPFDLPLILPVGGKLVSSTFLTRTSCLR